MPPVRKLAVPAVLTFVVLGTTALAVSSCGDDDGPLADASGADARVDGQPGSDAPEDGAMPDLPPI